uniref:Putative secreted peptide n=1 Tax=Anopheles braziliensis TaxID=58242 RepID=A0A2M3ZRG2_9DIPT
MAVLAGLMVAADAAGDGGSCWSSCSSCSSSTQAAPRDKLRAPPVKTCSAYVRTVVAVGTFAGGSDAWRYRP